ncbi:MAG: sulfide/dihydroorotate dehydrogenase-like FAD/NAD-binding protein [Lachnospiraceae bacterium]|nr:sulfide/dihydroorotate dehydrogenase-like FAD/NAD-binding protein [Lachnospiraceae bacterium]
MYKILSKTQLSAVVWEMVVEAPLLAKHCQPGQFLIVKKDEVGERIPLTICDYDREAGTVTIVFQPVGVATEKFLELDAGDCFEDFVGPLGRPSDILEMSEEELKSKKFLFVCGGVGTAPVYPQVKWLHEHGIGADVIIGCRTKDLLFYEDKMREVAENLYVTTDDGSYMHKGVVTTMIDELIEQGKEYNHCVCIGPMIMMKFCTLTTKKYNIPTIVSMNPIMVDGTGMCGACRLTVGDEVKFACVDGPEFDGFKINWAECMKRSQMYKTYEGEAKLRYEEGKTHEGGCGNC